MKSIDHRSRPRLGVAKGTRSARQSKLSEEQIRDAFRAGGYTHDDLEMYTQTMCKRIAELGAL